VPLIGFFQSNHHEHTTSIRNLEETPLASRASAE
jgi:ureidoglycolate hydrolase